MPKVSELEAVTSLDSSALIPVVQDGNSEKATIAEIAALIGGTPGGSTTEVQYNNAGAFGGSAAFFIELTAAHFLLALRNITSGGFARFRVYGSGGAEEVALGYNEATDEGRITAPNLTLISDLGAVEVSLRRSNTASAIATAGTLALDCGAMSDSRVYVYRIFVHTSDNDMGEFVVYAGRRSGTPFLKTPHGIAREFDDPNYTIAFTLTGNSLTATVTQATGSNKNITILSSLEYVANV